MKQKRRTDDNYESDGPNEYVHDGFVVSDTESEFTESESENETKSQRADERNATKKEYRTVNEQCEKDDLEELLKEANEFIGGKRSRYKNKPEDYYGYETEEMTFQEKQFSINRILTSSERLRVHERLPRVFRGVHFWLDGSLSEQMINELSWIIVVSGGIIEKNPSEGVCLISAAEHTAGKPTINPMWVYNSYSANKRLSTEKFISLK